MIHKWRGQEEELQNLEKNTHCFHTHDSEWPDLETEVNCKITDHRNNRICVYKTDHFLCKKVNYSHIASLILLSKHLAVTNLQSIVDCET